MFLQATEALPLPQTNATARAFASVAVYRDAKRADDAWAELESLAACSIYQTRAWLKPWIATLGRRAGLQPMIVVARDTAGRPLALLPFGLVKRGPLRIARWLGGADANFNMGLFRPGIAWSAADLSALLASAGAAAGRDRPDLYALTNQPASFAGRDNPFVLLARHDAPSAAYGTALPREAEALFAAKLSKDGRKKLRKKETRLAGFGPVQHLVVTDRDEQRRVIDRFLALRVARFRAQGIANDFEDPAMRAFIAAASAPAGCGIELHALTVGETIVAVYGGAAHGGQWSGMFNAFDTDEEIAKSSPGDLLLLRIIADACARGLARFDLGIGAARYKAALCDETIPLFDSIIPASVTGRIAAGAIVARLATKRHIKASPRLFALVKKARTLRARSA